MSTDRDLAAMVRDSIPGSELYSIDPVAIKTAAARRRTRQRATIFACVAVAAVSITGATLLTGPTQGPQETDGPPAAATTPTTLPRMKPGCSGPHLRITGAPEVGLHRVSTRVGAEVRIPAIVLDHPASTLLDGTLLVGAPGTTAGHYITDPHIRSLPPLPATDITRAEKPAGSAESPPGRAGHLAIHRHGAGRLPRLFPLHLPSSGCLQRGPELRAGVGIRPGGHDPRDLMRDAVCPPTYTRCPSSLRSFVAIRPLPSADR